MEFIGGLGEGTFSRVYLAKYPKLCTEKDGDVFAAVKVISKDHILKENLGPMMQAERKILMLLNSEFIVHLHASFQDHQNIYLLLECILGGELFDVYSDHNLYGDFNIA